MMKPLIESAASSVRDLVAFVPPGLLLCFAAAFIEGGKYLSAFQHEFLGTVLMIGCTFSAGKWIGMDDVNVAWAAHAVGVVVSDFIGGGQHVNPAVTVAMASQGKCTYTEGYVRIAGQIGGGLVAFPLFHAVSNAMKWTPFGGPEYHMPDVATGFLSEFISTLLLMFAIYILNWELNFGKFHYIIKQTLTAIAIRGLIEFFPTTGPAINPMLATTWDVFGVGTPYDFPSDFTHYFVYWVAPITAGITSAIIYTAYAGGTVFGVKNPVGPFKGIKKEEPKKKKS